MNQPILLSAVILLAGTVPAWAQARDANTPPNTTTVTNVSGVISQVNYGTDGQVQGFLIGANVLLSFPTTICGGINSLGTAANNITYSGTEVTASSGFKSVVVSNFKNATTGASYTAPTSSTMMPATTTYGPTSGSVKQLNYANDGSIDGFVFTPSSGSPVFVSTGERASSTLAPLLKVGTGLSVTGTTSPGMSGCASTDTLESVNATSLTIGSTTIVIAGGPGYGNPGGPIFPGPVGRP